jgi:hypothetical protein
MGTQGGGGGGGGGGGEAGGINESRPADVDQKPLPRQAPSLGKIMLLLVRAQLQGGAEAEKGLSMDLDAGDAGDEGLARPALVVSYQEWKQVESRQVAVQVLDHTVFSIHRVLVQAVSPHSILVRGDGHAREMGSEGIQEGGPGLEHAVFDTPLSPAHRRRGVDNERERGREVAWSSDEEDGARRPAGKTGRRVPGELFSPVAQNLPNHHGKAVQRHPGDARVMVSGVRLNWEAPMQHSMLQVCLAHYSEVIQMKQPEERERQTPWRAQAADFARESSVPDYSFAAPAPAPKEVAATMSLEVHDIWLNFTVTNRAVLGIDIPHAICSVTHHLCAHHPIQARDQHAADSSLCAVEVRDFAVHRLRDQAWDAPLMLQGSLGQATYEADCESRLRNEADCESSAPRPPPSVPSDRFFCLEVFKAAVPLTVLTSMDGVGHAQTDGEGLEKSAQSERGHVAHVQMVGVHVVVPMPPNISLHGRREGLRGRWSSQHRFINDSIAYWTPLGVMAGDCLQVLKALQVLVQQRMVAINPPASDRKPQESMTELPSGLPHIDLHLSHFDVKMLDDTFEIWMGAFQRLHRDEAAQRLKREEMLREQLESERGKGTVVSQEAETQMWKELARLNSQLWHARAAKFKRCEFFDAPPALMSFKVEKVTGLLMPRPASWLESKLAYLVSSPKKKVNNALRAARSQKRASLC